MEQFTYGRLLPWLTLPRPRLTSLPRRTTIRKMSGPFQQQLGRFLIGAGVVLVVFGIIVLVSSKFSWGGLGRLPGDIQYKGKNFQVYFPIVTCLVASAVLTLILWLISAITRR